MTSAIAAPLDVLYLCRIKQLQEEGFTLDESSGMASYEKALNVIQVMFNERVVEKSVEMNVKSIPTANFLTIKTPLTLLQSKPRLYLVK